MKTGTAALFLALCLLFGTAAQAEFYVSAGAGKTFNTGTAWRNGEKSDFDNSHTYSVAVGYDLPFIDIIRVEGEYLHNRAKIEHGGKATYDGVMANGYVDIPFPVPLFTPYVGIGLGPGRYEGEYVLGYQGMVGIDAEVFVVPLVASLEYRYMQTNRHGERHDETYKFYAHTVMMKLRYEF